MLFNVKKWPVIPMAAVMVVMAFAMVTGACSTEDTGGDLTPAALDYDISGVGVVNYNGHPQEVSITPRPKKSAGEVIVWYTGTGSTTYDKSSTAPTAPGTYVVTFDIEAVSGWRAVKGISAGMLYIVFDPDAPIIDDPIDNPVDDDPTGDDPIDDNPITDDPITDDPIDDDPIDDDPIDDDPINDPVTFTVTFDKNGGDTEASPKTRTVEEGETVALPTPPARDGYTFTGWNTDRNGLGTPFTASTVTGSFTVFAQWEPQSQPPILSSDASLASLTINGVAVTWPTNASAHPNSNVTYWADSSYYATISMTQTEFAGGNPLNIVATPTNSGARIRGYAINTTSGNLYTGTGGQNATNWEIKDENWVLTSEESYAATNFVNKSTRIFVWVEAEDGTWGFYRVNEITVTADPGDPGTPTLSSDASLASITINGGGTITWPTNAHPNTGIVQWVAADYTTITNAPPATGTLTILATPTDPKAKIVGYAVTGSSADLYTSNVNDSAKWASKGTYDATGLTEAFTWTGTFGSNRLFIWVQAEDGTNGFYRIQTISFSSP